MPQIYLNQGASQADFDALAQAKGLTKLDDRHATLQARRADGSCTVYDLFLVGQEIVGSAFDVLPAPASPAFKEWSERQILDFFKTT